MAYGQPKLTFEQRLLANAGATPANQAYAAGRVNTTPGGAPPRFGSQAEADAYDASVGQSANYTGGTLQYAGAQTAQPRTLQQIYGGDPGMMAAVRGTGQLGPIGQPIGAPQPYEGSGPAPDLTGWASNPDGSYTAPGGMMGYRPPSAPQPAFQPTLAQPSPDRMARPTGTPMPMAKPMQAQSRSMMSEEERRRMLQQRQGALQGFRGPERQQPRMYEQAPMQPQQQPVYQGNSPRNDRAIYQ